MEEKQIGINAGIVWNLLEGKECVEQSQLKKNSKLTEAEFWAAIGWLSREGKLVSATEKKGRKTVNLFSLAY